MQLPAVPHVWVLRATALNMKMALKSDRCFDLFISSPLCLEGSRSLTALSSMFPF